MPLASIRRRTITWNVVPWYIGSDGRIRPATTADIQRGLPYLKRLLPLLPSLRVIVLVGRKASRAEPSIKAWANHVEILKIPHPSPTFVNRSPDNYARVQQEVHNVRQLLDAGSGKSS